MYKKILMAYNGTHEGRIALFECAEVASFVKAETHLLAVGTPSMSMFVEGFEGIIPEQGSAQAQKLMKNVLAEGLAALTQRGYSVTGHLAVGESGLESGTCGLTNSKIVPTFIYTSYIEQRRYQCHDQRCNQKRGAVA